MIAQKGGRPICSIISKLEYTSIHLGYSQAQLLMCRRLQASVPTIHSLREPEVPDSFIVSQYDKNKKNRQKTNFECNHRDTDLKPWTQWIVFGFQTNKMIAR